MIWYTSQGFRRYSDPNANNPVGRCSRCSENTGTMPDDDYGFVSMCCGWPLLPEDWTPPTAMERE